jgi:WD40 repeat protein
MSGLSNPEIRRFNASTGKAEALIPSLILDTERMIKPGGLTRYGEYLIRYKIVGDSGGAFSIIPTDGTQKTFKEFTFSNNYEANLAVLLLKQAERITLAEGGLSALMPSGLTVELKGAENKFRIVNKKTGRQMIAPKDMFSMAKLSPDGKFLAARSLTISIWNLETGSLITDRIGQIEQTLFVDFIPDSPFIVTASSQGNISTWFIGDLKNDVPAWLDGLSEAISGMEINDNLDLVNIPQDRFFKLRNDYLKRLQEAADNGDVEAKYILGNFIP